MVLVGAGPGGPGLLTVAAVQSLRSADIVLYDRLAGPAFRRFVRPRTELVDVGKRPGASAATQDEICRRLVAEARSGRCVVRMKGGDPFVFGRGYEEVVACMDAGVAVSVVPGVSSALAGPGLAGIPLTHRGLPPCFTVLSGHEDPTKGRPGVDWTGLADLGGPLVLLMGVGTIARHAAVLIQAGMSPTTPVVAVENATTVAQRVLDATLESAADVFSEAGLTSPAVIVIGANAGLGAARHAMAMTETVTGGGDVLRALGGWRVIVPRSRGGRSELSALVAAEGATVDEVTVCELVAPAEDRARTLVGALRAGEVDLVVAASGLRVQALVSSLRRGGGDLRDLAGSRLVATSASAHTAFDSAGLRVDADSIPSGPGSAVVASLAGSAESDLDLLEAAGWDVTRVDVGEVRDVEPDPSERDLIAAADAVAFASSGTVSAWAHLGLQRPPVVACIGPETARAAEEAGLDPDLVAADPSLQGLVAALAAFAGGRG